MIRYGILSTASIIDRYIAGIRASKDGYVQAIASRTVEKAKEADVPVHRDDKLADTLSRLEIGEMIPPELYEVVAEILIFVDAMDKIKSKMDGQKK